MPVLVASDLDRTLIYSSAALALTMPDARAPRLLCVEVHESRPLSYLTETAAGLLTELGDAAVFVPTTTRTRKQYQRINLPGPVPKYAICANGGHILVDGVHDLREARGHGVQERHGDVGAGEFAVELRAVVVVRADQVGAQDGAGIRPETVELRHAEGIR